MRRVIANGRNAGRFINGGIWDIEAMEDVKAGGKTSRDADLLGLATKVGTLRNEKMADCGGGCPVDPAQNIRPDGACSVL